MAAWHYFTHTHTHAACHAPHTPSCSSLCCNVITLECTATTCAGEAGFQRLLQPQLATAKLLEHFLLLLLGRLLVAQLYIQPVIGDLSPCLLHGSKVVADREVRLRPLADLLDTRLR
jgi:hypothetical protein